MRHCHDFKMFLQISYSFQLSTRLVFLTNRLTLLQLSASEGDINITSQNKNNRCFFAYKMIYFRISSIWQPAWSNRVVLYMINYLIYDWLLMFLPYFKFVHYIDPSARARKSFITAFHTIKKAMEFYSNNSFSTIQEYNSENRH